VVLIVEYVFSGIFYRLTRISDFLTVDLISGLSAIALSWWIFRKLIRTAFKEKTLRFAVVGFFLFFYFLSACFLRFSLQLANGLLDWSEPQTIVVVISSKQISSFGGSLREGPGSQAHLIYFHDWKNNRENGELLIPPYLYYTLGLGTPLELKVRQGFFHWAWVEDFKIPASSSGG
jgi:hypothetical protein